MKLVLNLLAFAVLVAGAAFWFKASSVIVRENDKLSKGSLFVFGVDVQSTAYEQSRWNRYGAAATALGILLQAIGSMI